MHTNRAAFTITAACVGLLCLTSTGCKEEDTRLFDESGVWSLEKFSIEGGLPFNDIDQSRKDRFMLYFQPNDREEEDVPGGIVAAANCHAEGDTESVTASSCINPSLASWSCRCFAYAYDDDRMVWQEFAPGEAPPAVGNPAIDDSGAQEIFLEPFQQASSTYIFESLPDGLFDSDGENSKHVMQIRATSVWDNMDIDDADAPDLEFCTMGCFGG